MTSVRNGLWQFAFLAVVALAISGCAVVNPPQMSLEETDLGPPPGPSVTNIKVENGGGEVLYNGPRPSDGKIKANPTPKQLDGTMKITRTYSDGSTTSQTLTYEAGKPVRIEHSDASDDYYVDKSQPPGTPKLTGSANTKFSFRDRPDTLLFRMEHLGTITGIKYADNKSHAMGFEGHVGLQFDHPLFGLGKTWGLEFHGRSIKSTSETDIQNVPANGGDLSFFAPLTGGGAVTGNDIQGVRYRSMYYSWGIEPRLTKGYDAASILGRQLHMNSYLGFEYGQDEDDQDSDFSIPAINSDVMSRVMLDNHYYGPTFGFDASLPLCGGLSMTGGAFGKLSVNHLHASRAIDIGNTALQGSDSVSQTLMSMGGGAKVGLKYTFTPNFSMAFGYEYDYDNNTPVLAVDQAHGGVSVKTGAADVHRIFLGGRVTF